MSGKLVKKVALRLESKFGLSRQKLKSTRAPEGLSMRREATLGEGEAVALSVGLPGWLNPPASLATLHFLNLVPFGPVVEIGVFRGKYLSILRSGMGENCRIVGYDIFCYAPASLVLEDLTKAFGTLGNIELIYADSTKLTPQKVQSDCGGRPVFFSVDGSHEAEPVLSDLALVDEVLDEAGIVALDDVLNPVAIGVNEAVGRYLSKENCRIAPFAYVANKLFCCRPEYHQEYLDRTENFITARGADPSFAFFYENKSDTENLRRRFYGHDVLIATG